MGERQSHTICKFLGKPLHKLIESCVTEKVPLRKMASIFHPIHSHCTSVLNFIFLYRISTGFAEKTRNEENE